MKCFKRRNVFDLLEVYTCDDCPHYRKDEIKMIGEININKYYLGFECLHMKYTILEQSLNNKLKKILYEFSLNNEDYIIIWLDRTSIIEEDTIFDLLSFQRDIHILLF